MWKRGSLPSSGTRAREAVVEIAGDYTRVNFDAVWLSVDTGSTKQSLKRQRSEIRWSESASVCVLQTAPAIQREPKKTLQVEPKRIARATSEAGKVC